MRNDRKNLIVNLNFDLALEVVAFSERIRADNRLKWPIDI